MNSFLCPPSSQTRSSARSRRPYVHIPPSSLLDSYPLSRPSPDSPHPISLHSFTDPQGICGSDVHFYNTGRMGLVTCDAPMCLGHEAAGIIVQLGSNIAAQAAEADKAAQALANGNGSGNSKVKALPKKVLRLGDRVALEPGVTCRMCDDCRGGRYQVCRMVGTWCGAQRGLSVL